tara:strand:- start:924 stop:1085 length:162 start_codon:yes stop_codon:yes gene_type:complete
MPKINYDVCIVDASAANTLGLGDGTKTPKPKAMLSIYWHLMLKGREWLSNPNQ